jgi:hypothetical protein
VPLLPLGPSCPLPTILLSDPVGHGCLLQIQMTFWHTCLKFEARQIAIIFCSPTRTSKFKNKKVCQMANLICRGLMYPTRWSAQHGVFSRAEKPQPLFLMNMKGLMQVSLLRKCLQCHNTFQSALHILGIQVQHKTESFYTHKVLSYIEHLEGSTANCKR